MFLIDLIICNYSADGWRTLYKATPKGECVTNIRKREMKPLSEEVISVLRVEQYFLINASGMAYVPPDTFLHLKAHQPSAATFGPSS